MKKRSRKELIPLTGSGAPPGAVRTERGVRFAFFSRKAKQVTLLLYEIDASEPFATFPLTRSGDMRHIEIDGLFPPFEYLYLCETEGGEIRVADPYARRINTREQWGAPPPELRGRMYAEPSFDWQDSCRPLTPWGESIIYEMHVRGFTRDPSSRVRHPGRFTAIIEKIPYLKELGITAVELMPLHEFDETETHGRVGPRGERLHNYWGYGSTHFFAPMKRFGAPEELKTVVRELHKSGIEVIVDVVYNHTSDRFPSGPDGESYHIMHEGHHTNYSGCGNTLRCQHPVVRDLILSSLRYYMTEFQVDGFRFDLASVLTRNETGSPMDAPPLIAEITEVPAVA
ncbi:MAG: alpha-amylase family glycosyl hydrolase, partial [Simkaniaceae bacterium]|nr:alpha-amylase family glycosyl hydrolase [Simkaniaceae bacterium]